MELLPGFINSTTSPFVRAILFLPHCNKNH